MADVFISYSREDKEKIIPMVEGFKEIGLTVWYDAKVLPGTSFDEIIGTELDAAKAVLVCWSPISVHSKWVKSEASVALDQNSIVSCLVEPCVLRPPFTMTHAEDVSTWNGSNNHSGWRKIVEQIGQLVQRPGLVALLDAKASGEAEKLADWATTYHDDPYTTEVWKVWESKERERLAGQIQSLRQQFDVQIKQRKSVLNEKIANYEKSYSSWISSRRSVNSSNCPVAPDLAYASSALADEVTKSDLQAELKNANAKAADLETRLSAALKLKSTSGSAPARLKTYLGFITPVLCLIGGLFVGHFLFGGYYASSASVTEFSKKMESLTAERDAAYKALNEMKAAATANAQKLSQQQAAFDSKLRDSNSMRDTAVEDANSAKASVVELQNQLYTLSNPKKDTIATEQEKPKTLVHESGYRSYYNLDLAGGDFDSLPNIDLRGCEDACKNNKNCLAFTYNKWSNLCFLKSSISSLTLNPRSITGVRNDLTAPIKSKNDINWERHRNKRFPGDGYKKFNADNKDECESSCQNDSSCISYTFFSDHNVCDLFHSTDEYFSDTHAFSGAKTQLQ